MSEILIRILPSAFDSEDYRFFLNESEDNTDSSFSDSKEVLVSFEPFVIKPNKITLDDFPDGTFKFIFLFGREFSKKPFEIWH